MAIGIESNFEYFFRNVTANCMCEFTVLVISYYCEKLGKVIRYCLAIERNISRVNYPFV